MLTLCRFLLNYTSRDEVDLLSHGTEGFVEAREAIAKYEEESPLFGLVVYKKKKALLKYVPEGTSRLLQGDLHGSREVSVILMRY